MEITRPTPDAPFVDATAGEGFLRRFAEPRPEPFARQLGGREGHPGQIHVEVLAGRARRATNAQQLFDRRRVADDFLVKQAGHPVDRLPGEARQHALA